MHQPTPRGRLLATIIALAVLASLALTLPATTLAFGGDGLRAAVNEYRTHAGLAPVVGTELLDDIASHRASQMVAADRLEHDIDYVTHRLNRAGVCWKGVGEIIAWERGYPEHDYDRTVLAWWNSPDHHEIMMGADYNAAGGAWRNGDGGSRYSVMVFAVLCSAATSEVSISYLRPERPYDPDRALVVWSGRHTGFRFSADGSVVARRTVRYDHLAWRSSAGRAYVGGKAFLKVSSGALSGYWLPEQASSHVRGMTYFRAYSPTRSIAMDAGSYRGYRFTWYGHVTKSVKRSYDHDTHARIDARAIINGRVYLRFAGGWLDGYWVRGSPSISYQ
jgi:Cysteine-rich secretory protein family